MPPASNEEQFKFLISCIRYSNNGKVAFGEVAKECSIVSKGAAAKRYERMMRAHGIAPNAASIKPAPTRNTKSDRLDSETSLLPPVKKRKVADYMYDNGDDDEEVFGGNVKKEAIRGVEGESVDTKEHLLRMVVEENHKPLSLSDATNLAQYYDSPRQYGNSVLSSLDMDYNGSEFGGCGSGFGTPLGDAHSLHEVGLFQGFEGYMDAGMESTSGPVDQGSHYSMWGCQPEMHGRHDNPVILE